MADELSVTIKTALTNGNLKDSPPSNSFKVDQAAAGLSRQTHAVTTSDTAIPTGTITTLGWLKLKNLDATNYVSVGPDSGGAIIDFLRIEAGEEHVFRLEPGITPRWQANTATCEVEATFYED